MGALTLTCLSLLIGQTSNDVVPLNQRFFKIPIKISPQRQREIQRMILYVSGDRGGSWQQDSTVTADKDGFVFTAPRDGEYWFRAAAINMRGEQQPKNLFRGPPDQKVLIDTAKPNVRIVSARRQDNTVVVDWDIQETYPDWKSLKLSYRAQQNGAEVWTNVAIEPQLLGKAMVLVNNPNPLTFQLAIKDLAGNEAVTQANVSGTVSAASFQGSDPTRTAQIVTPGEKPTPRNVLPPPNNNLPPPPVVETKTPTLPVKSQTTKTQGVNPAQQPQAKENGNQLTSWDSTNYTQPVFPDGPAKQNAIQPISGQSVSYKPVPSGGISQVQMTRQPLPKVDYVSQEEVVLAYELKGIQPGRVGAVELWLTRDDGQRWERWMDDPAVKPYMKKGPHTRTLKLPGEGLYGLTIVVLNRAGRGKKPVAGDVPEMRIEVDMKPPVAVLYAPEQSKLEKGAMVISWDARDRNLVPNPITIEWAEQQDGPWHTVAANLPNTGKFSWRLPDSLPVYVYLRVRVLDKAGNEAVAVSNEAQLVDLSEPQGRLIGIVPPTGRQ